MEPQGTVIAVGQPAGPTKKATQLPAPTRVAKAHEAGRAARQVRDVVTLGAWLGSATRLKEMAAASSMSMGFILGAMQLHFGRISDEEKRAAVLRPFRHAIEDDRYTTVWACREVAEEIRAEADRFDMPVTRMVNALIEAWDALPDVGRTEAMKMELARVEERRRGRLGAGSPQPHKAEDKSGGVA